MSIVVYIYHIVWETDWRLPMSGTNTTHRAGYEWEFEVLAEFPTLIEGPAWDGTGLLFTEIAAGRIQRYDAETGECSVFREDTNRANGLMFDPNWQLFACESGDGPEGRRIVRYDPGAPAVVIVDQFEGKRLNSPNDLAVDILDRIWFTDPRYSDDRHTMELDHESVYRAEEMPDGSWTIHRVTFDTTRPNGLLISPDQQTLYVAQSDYGASEKRELRAYPINEDGSLRQYTVLHDFGPHRGIDGMVHDVDGNIIACAGWQQSGPGPMIYVFAPDGRVLQTHPVPFDRPTNCSWGGDDLSTLYITTGTGHLLRAQTSHTGRLWYPPLQTA
jgi:gluconolactonase